LQADILQPLLADLAKFPEISQVILVQNLPEPLPEIPESFGDSRFFTIQNSMPHGFGENHNQAFKKCETSFFCVMNPDIRLPENPFPALLEEMVANSNVSLCAPLVRNPQGGIEDSARKFPTPFNLCEKILGISNGSYLFDSNSKPFSPDWVGGMFMLLRTETFRELGGFDEGFFLYYEDVDLCARLRKLGKDIYLIPKAEAIHDARRTSRRSLRFLRWHIKSMSRYFIKHFGRLPSK